jgi:hypothetical protein
MHCDCKNTESITSSNVHINDLLKQLADKLDTTKEEIEQAAESYLMSNNHNEDTAIRDSFKAGFYFASRNDQSEFIKLQSENERLKAELESGLIKYKLLAGEACFETLKTVNSSWPDLLSESIKDSITKIIENVADDCKGSCGEYRSIDSPQEYTEQIIKILTI